MCSRPRLKKDDGPDPTGIGCLFAAVCALIPFILTVAPFVLIRPEKLEAGLERAETRAGAVLEIPGVRIVFLRFYQKVGFGAVLLVNGIAIGAGLLIYWAGSAVCRAFGIPLWRDRPPNEPVPPGADGPHELT